MGQQGQGCSAVSVCSCPSGSRHPGAPCRVPAPRGDIPGGQRRPPGLGRALRTPPAAQAPRPDGEGRAREGLGNGPRGLELPVWELEGAWEQGWERGWSWSWPGGSWEGLGTHWVGTGLGEGLRNSWVGTGTGLEVARWELGWERGSEPSGKGVWNHLSGCWKGLGTRRVRTGLGTGLGTSWKGLENPYVGTELEGAQHQPGGGWNGFGSSWVGSGRGLELARWEQGWKRGSEPAGRGSPRPCTAPQDHDFLENERIFLESLKKRP